MTSRLKIEQLSAGAVLLAALFVLFSLAVYFDGSSERKIVNRSSQVERDAAIERAKQSDGSYQYSTGFTPGIGQLGSPDQIKKEFETNNPGAITN